MKCLMQFFSLLIGVYIFDLLVKKSYRGQQNQPVYVMSDVDPYYEKLGYRREGSIFEVKV
jgi:hypothetical protein